MRILFVVPYVPSPIRTRPYHFVRGLLELGHDVTVAAPYANEADRERLDGLASQGARVITRQNGTLRSAARALGAIPSSWPLQAAYSWHPALAKAAAEVARSGGVDVAHIEHIRGARYARHLLDERRAGRVDIPVVWDAVDCVSQLFAQASLRSRSLRWRWMARAELERTRRIEARLATEVDRVVVTGNRDRLWLERVVAEQKPGGPPPRVSAVTNGVDLAGFAPRFGPRPGATLILTGKMSYHANVSAALHLIDDVMPIVWDRRPDVSVRIVGRDPVRAVRVRGQKYPERVVVTGAVADLGAFLQESTLAVAPLVYGVGVQNKVLEAMATATPVVATSQALGDLGARSGRELVVADGPDSLACAIVDLLGDPTGRDAIGRAGREYVEANHDWLASAQALTDVYEDVVRDVGGSSSDQR